MNNPSFNRFQTDSLLLDLEGWNDVLDVMAQSKEDVQTTAIRMVANAITDCVRGLRESTGLGPGLPEGDQ